MTERREKREETMLKMYEEAVGIDTKVEMTKLEQIEKGTELLRIFLTEPAPSSSKLVEFLKKLDGELSGRGPFFGSRTIKITVQGRLEDLLGKKKTDKIVVVGENYERFLDNHEAGILQELKQILSENVFPYIEKEAKEEGGGKEEGKDWIPDVKEVLGD